MNSILCHAGPRLVYLHLCYIAYGLEKTRKVMGSVTESKGSIYEVNSSNLMGKSIRGGENGGVKMRIRTNKT